MKIREAKDNYNKVHYVYLYTKSTLKMTEYDVVKFQHNNNGLGKKGLLDDVEVD